jgi:hypothetical protein
VDSNGYSSRIHSFGYFSPASYYYTILTEATHWYGLHTSPRKLLYCQPHLGLEIGDTAQWDALKGFVLDIKEIFQPGKALAWYQQILISDITTL